MLRSLALPLMGGVMFFFIWFLLAILVGVYASSKGRSGFWFFVIAILLSPLIGLLIALLTPPIQVALDAKAVASGEFKKCPNCAELVKAAAKLCKHCHSAL